MKFRKINNSLLIIDYIFYGERQKEIKEIDDWSYATFKYQPRSGMLLTFDTESDMNFFLLRWL